MEILKHIQNLFLMRYFIKLNTQKLHKSLCTHQWISQNEHPMKSVPDQDEEHDQHSPHSPPLQQPNKVTCSLGFEDFILVLSSFEHYINDITQCVLFYLIPFPQYCTCEISLQISSSTVVHIFCCWITFHCHFWDFISSQKSVHSFLFF